MAAISRRNDSVNASLAQIASASSMPAALDVGPQCARSRVGQVEAVAAVHEDHRVVEQGRVGDARSVPGGDRRGVFNSRPAASMRFTKARGAASQPPGWRSLATEILPRSTLVAGCAVGRRSAGISSFALHLAVGGIGQHVDADRRAASICACTAAENCLLPRRCATAPTGRTATAADRCGGSGGA